MTPNILSWAAHQRERNIQTQAGGHPSNHSMGQHLQGLEKEWSHPGPFFFFLVAQSSILTDFYCVVVVVFPPFSSLRGWHFALRFICIVALRDIQSYIPDKIRPSVLFETTPQRKSLDLNEQNNSLCPCETGRQNPIKLKKERDMAMICFS